MSRSVYLRPSAETDLDRIWSYTSENWGHGAAATYLRALGELIDLLAENPGIARIRHDFDPPVRIHPFRSHLVIYRSDETALDVMRIVHARQNWSEYLSE